MLKIDERLAVAVLAVHPLFCPAHSRLVPCLQTTLVEYRQEVAASKAAALETVVTMVPAVETVAADSAVLHTAGLDTVEPDVPALMSNSLTAVEV